jgi:hypothetical protein
MHFWRRSRPTCIEYESIAMLAWATNKIRAQNAINDLAQNVINLCVAHC